MARQGISTRISAMSLFVTLLALSSPAILSSCGLIESSPKQPNLDILDEDSAAWMTLNNTFDLPSGGTDFSPDLWSGLLVQLGSYEHGDVRFDSVKFYKGGDHLPNDDLVTGQFTWINIVSDWARSRAPMVDQAKRFMLFSDPQTPAGVCTPLDACASRNPPNGCFCDPTVSPCNDPAQLSIINKQCLRGRSLNRQFTPVAVITYWQGKHGFKMSGMQETSMYSLHNRYKFWFEDKFSVEVYDGGASPIKTYAPGEVDRIEINHKPQGPNHGDHQDPPWIP